jgi:hypothetical protein
VLWPDNTEHWILAMGRAHYDCNDEAYSMVGVTADITSRKTAEHERENF